MHKTERKKTPGRPGRDSRRDREKHTGSNQNATAGEMEEESEMEREGGDREKCLRERGRKRK